MVLYGLILGLKTGGRAYIELRFRGLGPTPFQMAPPTTKHLLGHILGSPYLRKEFPKLRVPFWGSTSSKDNIRFTLGSVLGDPLHGNILLVVSQSKGPQYRLQSTIVLIMGTPKRVPLNLGNPTP